MSDKQPRKYIHWLEYDGIRFNEKIKEMQLEELRRYLRNDPTAKAEGYFKNTGDVSALALQQGYFL